MQEIGHNNPPSQIEFAGETATALGNWLNENPVVADAEAARYWKLWDDRARLCLADMEAERKAAVAPLNDEVDKINEKYAGPKQLLKKLHTELRERLNAWYKKEEQERIRAAEEARKAVEAARLAAIEAARREQEAADDALHGAESDIATAAKEATVAFAGLGKAQRELARAEEAKNFKIKGGIGRALAARHHERLVVKDPLVAVGVMGWSERLLEDLLTDARLFRKEWGQLPDGIVDEGERSL